MMNHETSHEESVPEFIETVQAYLAERDYLALSRFLEELEDNDKTRFISRLPSEVLTELVEKLESGDAAEILHGLPEVQGAEILEEMESGIAAEVLENLPVNEQADLFGDLPRQKQESILDEMSEEAGTAIKELAAYPDDVAGSIMVVEFLEFRETQKADDVVGHLRENSEQYSDFDVQYAFVTDEDRRLVGVLRLRDLLMVSGKVTLGQFMIKNPLSVKTNTTLDELHTLFSEHSFLGVPVVDEQGLLSGVISRGDLEQALAERYSVEFRRSKGVVSEELRTMPTLLRTRRRLAWLSINILLNVFAASVIAMYQDVLAQVIALAVFLPIISDMSGCSGNQAVAVSMRELSLGLINSTEVIRVWMKEISVGLLNGVVLGGLLAIAAFIWKGNIFLGLVLGTAMCLNTMIAVSLGGILPLLMKKFNFDPALASGPILTTATDMCGFLLALSLAAAFIDYLN